MQYNMRRHSVWHTHSEQTTAASEYVPVFDEQTGVDLCVPNAVFVIQSKPNIKRIGIHRRKQQWKAIKV